MRKNSFLIGCFILMLSNIITRFIGFFYRVYMSKTIGAEAVGLFQLIMPIYIFCYSVTASGITTTVSKLISEESAKNLNSNCNLILKAALSLTLFLSLSLGAAMFFYSDIAATHFIKDIRAGNLLKLLSFCLPFMACGSCIKGYFLGKQTNIFPAFCQIFEQSVRMVSLFTVITVFSPKNINSACSAAVISVVFGEVFSFLLVVFFLFITQENNCQKKSTLSLSTVYKKILSMAIPLSSSRAAASFLSAVENILIPLRLSIYADSAYAISNYGCFTGMIMPLIHFPSSILSAVSTTMVPAISKQRTAKKQLSAQVTVNRSICFTAVSSCFSAVFLFCFAEEICNVIYSMPQLGEMLKMMSVICPLMYIQITTNSILNSVGKHFQLFIIGILSSLSSIGAIYFIMPLLGIRAFLYGSLISSSVAVIPAVFISDKFFNIKYLIIKYHIICFICAIFSYTVITKLFNIPSLAQMFAMPLLYAVLLFPTGIVKAIKPSP